VRESRNVVAVLREALADRLLWWAFRACPDPAGRVEIRSLMQARAAAMQADLDARGLQHPSTR